MQIIVGAEYEIAVESPQGLFKNKIYFVTDKLKISRIKACGNTV